MANIITIKRPNPRDLIELPMFVGPSLSSKDKVDLSQINAQLDTGNDHTVIRHDVLEQCGVTVDGEPILIQGVTGSEVGRSALTSLVLLFDNGEQCRIRDHVVVASRSLVCEALIGRDFLRFFDVHLSRDGTVILTQS